MSVVLPNEQDDYWWRLTKQDGTTIEIPPAYVATVQRKMTAKEPIHMKSGSVVYSEIKTFDKTSRRFTDVKLLHETAQAFNEPVITESGAVKARWMKKHVTNGEYDKYYRKSGSYHFLADTEGMVSVAFVLPVHKIDLSYMEYCTPEEERRLEK